MIDKQLIIRLKNCNTIFLKQVVDESDGILSIAENSREIPFNIKRTYHLYGFINPQAIRGLHAHKNLEQAIFCVNGSFRLKVDDGRNKQSFILDDPNQGIYIGPKLWHTLEHFSKDCIVLVFASDYFDESDYIRDYDEFKRYITKANMI